MRRPRLVTGLIWRHLVRFTYWIRRKPAVVQTVPPLSRYWAPPAPQQPAE